MPRAIWSGAVSFGLVNVPVQMFGAVTPKSVKFKQINSKTGGLVKQKRVDAETGDEVAYEDIVKGYEISVDRFVILDPAELEAVAPAKTQTVAVEQFVDEDQIDPLIYDSSYYLAPAKGGAAAYKLLCAAMAHSGKAAVARVILRSKEKLAIIRVDEGRLVVSTVVWADEINEPVEPDEAPLDAAQMNMAVQLIESLSADFDHSAFTDEYRDEVLSMIEAKAAGESVPTEVKKDDTEAAPDLMAALQASLAAPPSATIIEVDGVKVAETRHVEVSA